MEKNNNLITRLNEMKLETTFKIFLKLITLFKNSKDEYHVDEKFNVFLMEQTHPESKIFLRKFISQLNTFCPNFESMRYYINSINKILKSGHDLENLTQYATSQNEIETLKKCAPVLSEFKTFMYMFSKFIASNYLEYQGNELKIVIPQFDLLAPLKKWEETTDKIQLRNYDCLIAKDGTIYLAIWEHELLCYWLSMNNISLDNALRVCQNPTGQKTLSMSSLAPYKYHENTEKDKTMYLSDEQAKSLFAMFMKLSKGKRTFYGQTFEDLFCDFSENLGAGNYDSTRNLRFNTLTLEEVAGPAIFDSKICLQRVREKNENNKIAKEAYHQKLEQAINTLTEQLKKTN